MGRTPLRSADLLATFRADLERQRREVVESWHSHPETLLTTRPAPRKWSAIDCLEHSCRANAMYLRQMDRAIDRADGKRRPVEMFRPGALGEYMRRALEPKPPAPEGDGKRRIRSKMPTLGSFDPSKDAVAPDPTETLERFDQQLERMRAIGERMERVDLHVRTATLLGPLLKLRIGDVLRYLTAHTDRHLVQAERAMAQAGSRAS